MEVTKWLKPSECASRIGDGASVQAATRVNAEQASKRTMRRPTRRPFRGGSMYTRKAHATREAPKRGQSMTNRKPVRDRPGALGWRRGS